MAPANSRQPSHLTQEGLLSNLNPRWSQLTSFSSKVSGNKPSPASSSPAFPSIILSLSISAPRPSIPSRPPASPSPCFALHCGPVRHLPVFLLLDLVETGRAKLGITHQFQAATPHRHRASQQQPAALTALDVALDRDLTLDLDLRIAPAPALPVAALTTLTSFPSLLYYCPCLALPCLVLPDLACLALLYLQPAFCRHPDSIPVGRCIRP